MEKRTEWLWESGAREKRAFLLVLALIFALMYVLNVLTPLAGDAIPSALNRCWKRTIPTAR